MENENELNQSEEQVVEQTPEAATEQPQEEQAEQGLSQFLESISEDAEPEQSDTEEKADEEPQEKPLSVDESKEQDDKVTPEDIEAELLAEVKSERGQSRIRELLSGHKALQKEFETISGAVASTGLPPEGMAKVLDVCRLLASNDENELKVALQALDETRADICKRLGIAQPGVNPLDDFDDLKRAVEHMEITEDRALELAKLRRLQAAKQQEFRQQQAAQQQQQEYARQVQGFSTAANALFRQLSVSDPMYKAKEAKIAEALRNPAFVQTMISKFHPDQWLDQLKFMYDAIQVAPPSPPKRQTPISSRPARLGVTTPVAATGADRIDQILGSLGI
jgi:hypothetical protein